MSLHDLLEDLAADAPLTGLPPQELWHRGRRAARVRRLGTVAIVAAACLGLLVLTGVGWQSRTAPTPSSTRGHAPAMPDRLYSRLSGWLPTYAGAPGTLAAIMVARQNTVVGSASRLVGVSAVSGRYAFLSLPNITQPDLAVLSPDGRQIGYWITGKPSSTVFAMHPRFRSQGTAPLPPVVGYAVFDTTTGHSRVTRIPTKHGLFIGTLTWAGNGLLYAPYGEATGPDSAGALHVGLVGAKSITPTVRAVLAGDGTVPVGHDRVLVPAWRHHPQGEIYDVRTGGVTTVTLPLTMPTPAVSPDGGLIAMVAGEKVPGRMTVKRVSGPIVLRTSSLVVSPLAWIDDEHLAIATMTSEKHPEGSIRVVDLGGTGPGPEQTHTVVRGFPRGTGWLVRPQRIAYDLLADPTVHADRPPSPWGPRKEMGFGGGVVLVAAAAGIMIWRRRARP